MRKKFLLQSILWATVLILFSCRKENADIEKTLNQNYEYLIPKIKSWLDKQKMICRPLLHYELIL